MVNLQSDCSFNIATIDCFRRICTLTESCVAHTGSFRRICTLIKLCVAHTHTHTHTHSGVSLGGTHAWLTHNLSAALTLQQMTALDVCAL
jgi:hypothetical protein